MGGDGEPYGANEQASFVIGSTRPFIAIASYESFLMQLAIQLKRSDRDHCRMAGSLPRWNELFWPRPSAQALIGRQPPSSGPTGPPGGRSRQGDRFGIGEGRRIGCVRTRPLATGP